MAKRGVSSNAVVLMLAIVLVLVGFYLFAGGSSTNGNPANNPNQPSSYRAGNGSGRHHHGSTASGPSTVAYGRLPLEARQTVMRIEAGGPFPYEKDGFTFSNRERLLPPEPGGFYKEYTVATPESPDRGARRIVQGSDNTLYYTADHYGSFRRITGVPTPGGGG